MRLVGIKSLMTGDILAAPVYTSSGKVILNSGSVINDSYKDKLIQLKISKVYIVDDRFSDVEIIEPFDHMTRSALLKVIQDTHNMLHKSKSIDEYLIKDTAKKIVDLIRESKDRGISILTTEAVDDYVVEHTLNVGILSAFLGNRMSYNFNQLCDLVAGALVHDLGRENTPQESNEHVQVGFDVMRKCRGLSLHSSIVCYEHHENFNGTGYPRNLKGTGISEFSRVVRVADFYDISLHGFFNDGKPQMPHQAFESILAVSGSMLDPDLVEKFRDTIIFYPNGCNVLLSNGLKGIVVRQNTGSPHRPVVRVYNDNGIIGEIDLLRSLTIFIQDVLVV